MANRRNEQLEAVVASIRKTLPRLMEVGEGRYTSCSEDKGLTVIDAMEWFSQFSEDYYMYIDMHGSLIVRKNYDRKEFCFHCNFPYLKDCEDELIDFLYQFV